MKQSIQKLIDQLEYKKECVSFTMEAIQSKNKYYRALSDIIHSINLSESFTYNTILNLLEWLQDCDFEDIDDARDTLYEFCDAETPVYTNDLTAWLAESNYHVYYLENAVTEHGATDGFKILSSAYYLAVEEIAHEVLNVIEELND